METKNEESSIEIADGKCVRFVLDGNITDAVNRITGKRFFALVNFADGERPEAPLYIPEGEYAPLWMNIFDGNEASQIEDDTFSTWLYVGSAVGARDSCDKGELVKRELACYCERSGCSIETPAFHELRELLNDKTLACDISTIKERTPKDVWLHDVLRLPQKSKKCGHMILADDATLMRIQLQRTCHDSEVEDLQLHHSRQEAREVIPCDVRGYEIYDRFKSMIAEELSHTAYGDALVIPYSEQCDGRFIAHFAIMFYSNHVWDADPVSVLDVGIEASIVGGVRSDSMIAWESPQKVTVDNLSGERFFINEIAMKNNVAVKWHSTTYPPFGDGVERPDDRTTKDRILEVPSLFRDWLERWIYEIEMA